VIIPKSILDTQDLKILDQKPRIIPAWDPLRRCLLDL
jgi:hypothetical protein